MPPKPRTLSDSEKAQVEGLSSVLTIEQMADFFGIGRTTFFAIMERDPSVAELYKRGRAKAVGAVAQSLISQARDGNMTAMIFYLKTQGGWRETSAIELAGPGGGPIQTEDVTRDRLIDEARRLGIPVEAFGFGGSTSEED